MKKKYLITFSLLLVFVIVFALYKNANSLYLLNNHNIDKVVIDDVYNSENSLSLTDKNEIDQLVSCFNNYNLRQNKAEAIDSIMQYKISFYENGSLIVTIEMNITGKDNNWAYNICRIYTVDENIHFKIPDSFIVEVKNMLYSN